MNIVPHSVPQDSNAIKTTLPYNQKYVLFAIYEVLDKKGAEYEKINATTIEQVCKKWTIEKNSLLW